MSCCAVIPAYNEDRHIGTVIHETRPYVDAVIVVDDGSTDTTADAARRAGAFVISLPQRSSKGSAISTGLAHVMRSGPDAAVLLLDADGQHPPACIPAFIDTAARTDAGLVIGNRMKDPGAMPARRQFLNRLCSRVVSSICRQEIPDVLCGMRLLSPDLARSLTLTVAGFEVEVEIVFQAADLNAGIAEVPIPSVYEPHIRSHLHLRRDTLAIGGFILRRIVLKKLHHTSGR